VEYPNQSPVRVATLDDLNALECMSELFYRSTCYNGRLPYDPKKVRKIYTSVITGDQSQATIFIKDDAWGCPCGMLFALATELPFTSVPSAIEMVWYVQEDFRKSRVGLELLRAFEEWATLCGYPVVQTGAVGAPDEIKQLDNFYVKKGYSPGERYYYKDM
jgi:GNAT superfamily N-acetyltransferase